MSEVTTSIQKIYDALLLITLFILFFSTNTFAQDTNTERVKRLQRTIFIYNFAQQIAWPDFENLEHFKIGVLGSDPTITDLQSLAQKRKLLGKPIEIIPFTFIKDIKNIQLLYVNNKYNFNITHILNKIAQKNILLITEDYDYNTSMINMINVGATFEYEINTQRIEKEKLVIASTLKKHAIDSAKKWKTLYESTEKSLTEVVDKNEQQQQIIEQKEQEINTIEEQVSNLDGLVENLAIESEIQKKKYEEKVVIEKKLEQNIKQQVLLIKDQEKKIQSSSQEIQEQQQFLEKQKGQIKTQEDILNRQIIELKAKAKINILLILLILLFLIGSFFIYRGYIIKKRLSKNLEETNHEIYNQSLVLASKNKELKKKNSAIRKQSRSLKSQNDELEQFAYIASHDLQEPLNTISSFITVIDEDYGDNFDEMGKSSLAYIKGASIRMKKLINALLDYSRLGRSKDHTQVNCEKIIDELKIDLKNVIETTQTKISTKNLPIVKGSEIELRLLFQNLISNAIKFTKPEVLPEIHISCVKKTKDKNEATDFWEFSVKDNGIGIAEQHIKKVFDIFQRLHSKEKYKGTGIGLAHCKKIVESHEGRLWITSKEGEGSIFYFTIPS